MPLFSYWKEYAAFISVLPRQSGKSTMLKDMVHQFDSRNENHVIFVPNESIQKCLIANVFPNGRNKIKPVSFSRIDRLLQGIIYSDMHLLVDEFDMIERPTLDSLLNRNWRSVSMVSTLR